jgi:methionyl-tRNA formyltransferase
MRIVFIGAVQFSLRALQCLREAGAEVVGVCTLQESAFNADHCDLGGLATALGIPWTYAPDINSQVTLNWIAGRGPDVIFCFGWSRLLRNSLLVLAPLGVVGFHPSALPANRGRHPIIWALALGLEATAATFFRMDGGADSGDILSQHVIAIDPEDDAATLYEKITVSALDQLRVWVPQLAQGTLQGIPQDHGRANIWRKRGKADGLIDWRMSARSVHNLVRALAKPYVGAHFSYRGQDVKVWKTQFPVDAAANIEPGKILAHDARGILVKCGEQAIRLSLIEPVIQPKVGEYL